MLCSEVNNWSRDFLIDANLVFWYFIILSKLVLVEKSHDQLFTFEQRIFTGVCFFFYQFNVFNFT